ncbi:MAG: peptidoglycan DD-metalloendopeptidase family protein [Thermonemataceae bacterium]|nr:peptidoglycan DD-metalloendopeptidase family protein [Thermonemataceae bacterium]
MKKHIFFFGFVLAFMALSLSVWGQSRKQLEEEKKAKMRKVSEIGKILKEASSKKERSIGELNALNAQISERESVKNTIQKEINLIERDISDSEKIIIALEEDLKSLKKEYAKMIYEASKISNSYNQLNFIISSNSFNDLLRRMEFVKQYSEARKKQFEEIEKTKKYLEDQNLIIKKQREEKNKVLVSYDAEDEELERLKTEQSEVIKDLTQREAELIRKYKTEKKELEDLEAQVVKLIREEIKKSASGDENVKNMVLNAEEVRLAGSFSRNKGALPWPVDNGFISMGFGKQKHPVIQNVYLDNPGIKIQAKQGSKIKAIFEGKVEAIRERMGPGYSVMINHGDFFTIYEPVDNLSIKENQKVQANQTIGSIVLNLEGTPEILFSIYKNDKKLDPRDWLYKK